MVLKSCSYFWTITYGNSVWYQFNVSAIELVIQAPGDISQSLGVEIKFYVCSSIHIKSVAMLIKTVHSLYYTVLNFIIQYCSICV